MRVDLSVLATWVASSLEASLGNGYNLTVLDLDESVVATFTAQALSQQRHPGARQRVRRHRLPARQPVAR